MRETWLSPDSLGARANETLVLFAVGQVREPSLEVQLVEELLRDGLAEHYPGARAKAEEFYKFIELNKVKY